MYHESLQCFIYRHYFYLCLCLSAKGIGIECPSTKDVTADNGVLTIDDPRMALRINAQNPATITQVQYQYIDATTVQTTQTRLLPATIHTLENFAFGETVVTVQITDGIERALCTFRAIRLGKMTQ